MQANTLSKISNLTSKSKQSKTIAIALALLLMLTMTTFVSTALADYTKMPDRATYTEVGISPTTIGLGQERNNKHHDLPRFLSGPTYEAQSLVGGLVGGFSNISITVTKPDGSKRPTYMPIDETLAQGRNRNSWSGTNCRSPSIQI